MYFFLSSGSATLDFKNKHQSQVSFHVHYTAVANIVLYISLLCTVQNTHVGCTLVYTVYRNQYFSCLYSVTFTQKLYFLLKGKSWSKYIVATSLILYKTEFSIANGTLRFYVIRYNMTSIRNQTNGPLFQDAKGPTYVSQSNLTSALACKLTFVLLRKLTLLQAN